MKYMMKYLTALALIMLPSLALAQENIDGNDVATNIVEFMGVVTWLILAVMVLYGIYCLYVFGSGLQKMGNDENPQEKPKPRALLLALAGAIVCTYGTFTLGVAMRTVYTDDATPNATFEMPTRPTASNTGG